MTGSRHLLISINIILSWEPTKGDRMVLGDVVQGMCLFERRTGNDLGWNGTRRKLWFWE